MERTLCTTTVAFLLKHKLFVDTLRSILAGENNDDEDIDAVAEVLACFDGEIPSIIDAVAR